MITGLLGLLIALAILALIGWFVFRFIPMPEVARVIVGLVFAIIAIVLVCRYFGIAV